MELALETKTVTETLTDLNRKIFNIDGNKHYENRLLFT